MPALLRKMLIQKASQKSMSDLCTDEMTGGNMTIKHPTLGNPALVSLSSGGTECNPLTRTALQGEAVLFKENFLQQLIMSNPSVLPVKDMLPTTAALISLGREIAVGIGGQSGFIDNLLVTNEGRLVLVETKLWRNPESTREVIMQTLQYGMALSALRLMTLRQSSLYLRAKDRPSVSFSQRSMRVN